MSSLVLLNRDGIVARKLPLVSLPSDYVVPEGMTVSWRTNLKVSSRDPLVGLFGNEEPVEAYFYLGNAQGQVCSSSFKKYECVVVGQMRYSSRVLTVTVQGTSAKDVMDLRDRIMHFIHAGVRWNVSNDLNLKPKTGLLHQLKKMVGMAK